MVKGNINHTEEQFKDAVLNYIAQRLTTTEALVNIKGKLGGGTEAYDYYSRIKMHLEIDNLQLHK